MLPGFLAGLLWANPEVVYHQLALKDLDQMTTLVNQAVLESKEEDGDLAPLKTALRTVLSRPDEDFMIDKVIGPLRQELEELGEWEKVMNELVDESLSVLNKPKGQSPAVQVTHSVFLTNVISQMKPRAAEKGFERKTLEKIQKADVRLSKQMRDERNLRMMKDSASPSVLAEQALSAPKKK